MSALKQLRNFLASIFRKVVISFSIYSKKVGHFWSNIYMVHVLGHHNLSRSPIYLNTSVADERSSS
jgi:hypothetical protein